MSAANAVALPQENMDPTTELERWMDQVRTAEHHGVICEPLIKWAGLPEGGRTYGWFGMLARKHGIEVAKNVVLNVLERGWGADDFDDGVKGFRAYITGMFTGIAQRGPEVSRSRHALGGKYDRR